MKVFWVICNYDDITNDAIYCPLLSTKLSANYWNIKYTTIQPNQPWLETIMIICSNLY